MVVKFYKVGGCVRDSILGTPSKDIDFSVEAESYDVMRDEIVKRGGHIFLETPQYLTIRAHTPDFGAADFVLCRKDGAYSDGRRPDEVETGTLHDDLARRDFTMNAIAQDEQGNLIDPFNGVQAIAERNIRCVGDAEERFREDYLRMLRAMRFHITKHFRLDRSIEGCLHNHDMCEGLKKVSIERVREECFKAFMFDTAKTLDFFHCFDRLRFTVFDEMGLRLKPTLEQGTFK